MSSLPFWLESLSLELSNVSQIPSESKLNISFLSNPTVLANPNFSLKCV